MLSVTPIYGGLTALLFLWLSIAVIRQRYRTGVSVGDGGNPDMIRSMRAQANCAEYAPIGLLLMLLTEAQGAPYWLVHLLGVMLLTGRVMHAIGFGGARPIDMLRGLGMVVTFAMLLTGAISTIGYTLF